MIGLAGAVARVGMVLVVVIVGVACEALVEIDPELAAVSGAIRARNIAFEPADVIARAGVNLSIRFENEDDSIPHGVRLMEGATVIAESEIVTGPGRTTLDLPPMTAGSYSFTCPVHPNMTGTLRVVP